MGKRPGHRTGRNGGGRFATLPLRMKQPASRLLRLAGFVGSLAVAVGGMSPALAADGPPSGVGDGFVQSAQSPTPSVPAAALPAAPRKANAGREPMSAAAREMADWVVGSGNNDKLPFIVVDKVEARTFAFDMDGNLLGATSVLLGLAHGDDSVPGIGERKLSTIRPEERTTPAGRFVASLDTNLHGQDILWVDYDAAISLHAVVPGTPKERRAARLASPASADKRISYGCINVPAAFFQKVVRPAFLKTEGVVYVLPETRKAHETFAAYGYPTR